MFDSISVSDAGTYVCRARNNAGSSEAKAEVIVNGTLCAPDIYELCLFI